MLSILKCLSVLVYLVLLVVLNSCDINNAVDLNENQVNNCDTLDASRNCFVGTVSLKLHDNEVPVELGRVIAGTDSFVVMSPSMPLLDSVSQVRDSYQAYRAMRIKVLKTTQTNVSYFNVKLIQYDEQGVKITSSWNDFPIKGHL